MSIYYKCDFCGKPIGNEEVKIELVVKLQSKEKDPSLLVSNDICVNCGQIAKDIKVKEIQELLIRMAK